MADVLADSEDGDAAGERVMRGRKVYVVTAACRTPLLFTNALYALSYAGGPDRDKSKDTELAEMLWQGLGVLVWRRGGGCREVRRQVLH